MKASSRRTSRGYRRGDPDETEGRLFYRQQAEAAGRRSTASARRVTLVTTQITTQERAEPT